jgi:hypothetical protein
MRTKTRRVMTLALLLPLVCRSGFSQDGLQLFHRMQKALGGAEQIAAIRDFEQTVRAETWSGNTGASIGEVRKRIRWIRHQRCWVHKMRKILEKARKCDCDEVKAGAHAIYRAEPNSGRSRVSSLPRPLAVPLSWRREAAGTRLVRAVVVLRFPPLPVAQTAHRQPDRRCFVEVRRRTRPMVCFVNVESVDRIIYSIFQRFNLEWNPHPQPIYTSCLTSPIRELMSTRPFLGTYPVTTASVTAAVSFWV